jgi:hypothetical protein
LLLISTFDSSQSEVLLSLCLSISIMVCVPWLSPFSK